jgi:hypothetical protein
MNMLKTLAVLALGSAFLAGCGADRDETDARTDAPSPAIDTPAVTPGEESPPAETTDAVPTDEADPAMSDTLPTAEDPPPVVPAPPPG